MDSGRSQPRVILYKRWALRDDIDAELVADFVGAQIVPMYERLSGHVTLGLEVVADARAVMAIQRWDSRSALEEAMSGPDFGRWWGEYERVLAQWDAMVIFEREWETLELIA